MSDEAKRFHASVTFNGIPLVVDVPYTHIRLTVEGTQLLAMPDDNPAPDWAKDVEHKRVADVMDSIIGGKITKPAREALRKTLDKADAAPTGRAKSDGALGRAIRYVRSE